MSKLWEQVLNWFNYIGDHSGCHQIPERCFTVKGYTFPLCARCCGAFLGQMGAVIAFVCRLLPNVFVGAVLLGIMGVDWSLQYFKILESTNSRRFITGLCGGFGYFVILFNALLWILRVLFKSAF